MSARDSGQLSLSGVKANKYFTDFKKMQELDISFVYQEDVLWLDKTVNENIEIVGKLKGMNDI